MATVEVSGLYQRFGRMTALHDVSFQVTDGEFFVLLGPSGAGKTTILKAIAGLVPPGRGTVRIDGRDVAAIDPHHRDLAMCFESYALYPHYDVFGNLASPLRSPARRLRESEVRARVRQTANLLGIEHLLDRPVTELSNGQRQRVALGRVLVRPAHAYLLDEPLAHLDAKLRATMRAELKAISARDLTTTIYVTHDHVEALSLADRIAVLRSGRVVQVGTPAQIWTRPADVFVARAFGKPRLSLLNGVLQAPDGEPRFVSGDGAVDIPLPPVSATAGEPVQLGIRPGDAVLHIGCGDVPSGQVRLDGVVYVLEHLGRQTEVTVQIGESLVSVVVPRDSVPALALDDKVGVLIDPSTTHVFLSGDEGRRISP